MGWGGAIDKLLGQFGSRKERLRIKRDKLQQEMDELLKTHFIARDSVRYHELSVQLRKVEKALEAN